MRLRRVNGRAGIFALLMLVKVCLQYGQELDKFGGVPLFCSFTKTFRPFTLYSKAATSFCL